MKQMKPINYTYDPHNKDVWSSIVQAYMDNMESKMQILEQRLTELQESNARYMGTGWTKEEMDAMDESLEHDCKGIKCDICIERLGL